MPILTAITSATDPQTMMLTVGQLAHEHSTVHLKHELEELLLDADRYGRREEQRALIRALAALVTL